MSKWENEKEELNRLINIDKVSYEEIGRRYNCSGSNIKKVARSLGIELPSRRKINPKETFNKGEKETHLCLYCGKEISNRATFCDNSCRAKYEEQEYIKRWLEGKENGLKGKDDIKMAVKNYLFEIHNSSCEKCGWNEVNPYTGRVPLQIHHIDGNCMNNKPENLQLLCPNCHSLTENFGSRNKNCTRVDKRLR